MKLKEALDIVEEQLSDYRETSDNFERVFPGAVSAYRPLEQAYTIAAALIRQAIDERGEEYEM